MERSDEPPGFEPAREVSLPDGHAGPAGRLLARVTLGALLLASIGIFVPIQTEPGMGIEYWWPITLSEAFLSKLQFGVDVIDTYGPWGFVIGGYHPRTLALATALRGLIAVVAILSIWDAARASTRRRWPAALLVGGVLLTAVISWSDFLVTIWTFVFLVRTMEFPERRTSPLGIALLVVSGLVALMKFSSFVALGVIVAAVTIDDFRRRVKPVSLVVWFSTIAILWLAAGQSPSAFPKFIRWSLLIAGTYTEAVGIDAELYQPWSLIPFIASMTLFAVAMAFRKSGTSLARKIIMLSALWVSLFFLFKWGFVRADHFHIAPACGALLVTQAMFAMVVLSEERGIRRRWLAAPLVVSILISMWLVGHFVRDSTLREVGYAMKQATSGVRQLAVWSEYERGLLSNHAKARAMLPTLDSAAVAGGTADAYPSATGIVLQPAVAFEPRPVFRSYHTFTPILARLNVEHLRTSPPDIVVFGIDPIDRRYPSLEDGASWPLLLANYTVAQRVTGAVVLRRRDGADDPRLDPSLDVVQSFEARLGERVPLPSGFPQLYARVEIDLTTPGRILNLVYKPPELEIEVVLGDGTTRKRRLVRGMAASEFMLSPYVAKPEEFATMFPESDASSLRGRDVREITISVKGRRSSYAQPFRITLLAPVNP